MGDILTKAVISAEKSADALVECLELISLTPCLKHNGALVQTSGGALIEDFFFFLNQITAIYRNALQLWTLFWLQLIFFCHIRSKEVDLVNLNNAIPVLYTV